MIIDPALACSPSESLTPRNFGFESLKFDVDPVAFVCAIIKYMLRELLKKVKEKENDLFIVLVLILVAIIGFALGRISAIKYSSQYKINASSVDMPNLETLNQPASAFVGSKEGSVYHLISCPGAKSIKQENKIFFGDEEEAKRAGYRPAANCPGLK